MILALQSAFTQTIQQSWQHMFQLPLPVLEKVARPVIVFLVLVLLLRLFGKRELAQLNPFDLVVLLSLSNTVQNAIIGDDNSVTGGVIGAFSLLAINWALTMLLFRHPKVDQVVEGTGMIEVSPPRERVVLVAAPRKGSPDAQQIEEHLGELARLVDTAGGEIVGTLTQQVATSNPATLIGEGKVQELRSLVIEKKATFRLSGAQKGNMPPSLPLIGLTSPVTSERR